MGFDIQRFPNGIDEELVCIYFEFNRYLLQKFHIFSGAICGGVLQDPLQAPTCEHAFCQVNKNNFISYFEKFESDLY
jgi:E3 ubiquitin-protein ligase NRDP1